MNRSTFLIALISFSVRIAGFSNSCSIKEDTIHPLQQINKEFLISVTVFLDKAGHSNFDSSQLASTLLSVNSAFLPIKASFKICEIHYVPNFQYDTLNRNFFNEILIKYYQSNRMNMFFASTLMGAAECGFASLGGVNTATTIPGSAIVIQKGGCTNAGTIAHELGHYFSLQHTFTGSGTELVNESNCNTVGDLICDTPADPYIPGDSLSEYINSNCVFINTRKDANGNYYDPDVSNIMSYYSSCICLRFTRDQYNRMSNFYMQTPSIW